MSMRTNTIDLTSPKDSDKVRYGAREIRYLKQDLVDRIDPDNFVSVSAFSSLNEAISSIGSNKKVLVIGRETSLTSSLVVPENVHMVVLKTGTINLPAGMTLTINGTFEAGSYQVFDGSGNVNFGNGSVEYVVPEWWGAKGDGVTDDHNAIQKAIDSFSIILLGPVSYYCGSTINITTDTSYSRSYTTIIGYSPYRTSLNFGSSASVGVDCSGSDAVTIRNLSIRGSCSIGMIKAATTYNYSYIHRHYTENVYIAIDPNNQANGGIGTVGVLLLGSEEIEFVKVNISADVPVVATCYRSRSVLGGDGTWDSPFVEIADTHSQGVTKFTGSLYGYKHCMILCDVNSFWFDGYLVVLLDTRISAIKLHGAAADLRINTTYEGDKPFVVGPQSAVINGRFSTVFVHDLEFSKCDSSSGYLIFKGCNINTRYLSACSKIASGNVSFRGCNVYVDNTSANDVFDLFDFYTMKSSYDLSVVADGKKGYVGDLLYEIQRSIVLGSVQQDGTLSCDLFSITIDDGSTSRNVAIVFSIDCSFLVGSKDAGSTGGSYTFAIGGVFRNHLGSYTLSGPTIIHDVWYSPNIGSSSFSMARVGNVITISAQLSGLSWIAGEMVIFNGTLKCMSRDRQSKAFVVKVVGGN